MQGRKKYKSKSNQKYRIAFNTRLCLRHLPPASWPRKIINQSLSDLVDKEEDRTCGIVEEYEE